MNPETPKSLTSANTISSWEQDNISERQAYWRSMYQTDETNPYRKDKQPIQWNAFKHASYELMTEPVTFAKNLAQHIRAIDIDFRGGVDIGDGKLRLQRALAMAGNAVPFFVFDVLTSIPSGLAGEYAKEWIKRNGHLDAETQKTVNAMLNGAIKIMDVQNDKVVTALGDILASKRTGEKAYFTHEIWDKAADLGQTAMDDYVKDAINGPVLESVNRILYQVPIAGALWEQLCARITALQEKSALNKGIAKSYYMGIGTAIGVYREVKNKTIDEKRAPSTRISQAIWKVLSPRLFTA